MTGETAKTPKQRVSELEAELARTKGQLAAATSRMEDFAKQADCWFWETDEHHRFVYFSENVEALCGHAASENIGVSRRDFAKLMGDDSAWQQHLDDLDNRRPFKNFRYTRLDKKGDLQYLVTSGWPVFDQNGKFQGYRGAARDETEEAIERARVRSLEADHLKAIELQRDQLQRRTEDFAAQTEFWFWETDRNYIFSYLSDNVRTRGSIDPAEIIGTSRLELARNNKDEAIWSQHLDDLENQRAFEGFRYVRIGSDGRPRHLVISGWPTYNKDGEFRGFRGTGRDETKEVEDRNKLAAREHALQEENRRKSKELELVLGNLSQSVLWFDQDGSLRFHNPRASELHQYSEDEIAACKSMYDYCRLLAHKGELGDGDEEELARQHMAWLSEGYETSTNKRLHLVRQDRHLRTRMVKIPAHGIIITHVDVTKEVLTEMRLEDALSNAARQAKHIKRQRNDLQMILDNLSQSVMWFDGSRTLKLRNTQSAEVHGFDDQTYSRVLCLEDHLMLLAERGDLVGQSDYAGNLESLVKDRAEYFFRELDGVENFRIYLPSIDRHLQVRLTCTPDGGRLLTQTDITDEIAAEAEIEKQRNDLKMIVDNMSQSVMWFDKNNKLLLKNPKVLDIHGFSEEEYASVETLYDHLMLLAKRGDLAQMSGDSNAKDLDELVRNRIAFLCAAAGDSLSFYTYLTGSGRHVHVRNIGTPDGGRLITHSDITAELTARNEIEEQRNELQTVLDNLTQSVMWLDKDRNIRLKNRRAAEVHGFTAEEYAHVRNFKEHVTLVAKRGDLGEARDEDELRLLIKERLDLLCYDGIEPKNLKIHFPSIGRSIQVRVSPLPDGGRILAQIDVTEQVRAEQGLERARLELEQANEFLEERVEERTRELKDLQSSLIAAERQATLGKLTASLSHELRNPLNALKTTLYVIRSKLGNQPNLEKAFERSERTIQRMTNVLTDCYEYTLATEITAKPVDLYKVVSNDVSTYSFAENIDIHIDVPEMGCEANADATALRNALHKVLTNATQAVLEDKDADGTGKIYVSAEVVGDRFEIIVTDTGHGMDEETRAKALEPLFSTRGFGVGLGLPIARQIFTRHGGDVEITTEQNKGTTVLMWLPISGQGKQQEAA